MDLIIKPTESCNFKCTFCSSSDITEVDSRAKLPLTDIANFLDEHPNTQTIIINGGDPLMMPPAYYWGILGLVAERGMDTNLSFTTNLWAFYVAPHKWYSLFQHPRVNVTTSFQFGTGRLKGDGTPYSVQDFWDVSNQFVDYFGYRPDFIAVVATKEDRELAIESAKLAKKMQVECKINYAMASGRQSKPLLLAHIYRIYLQIWREGLAQWEYNTKDIAQVLKGQNTTCPRNRKCQDGIRCLQPEGDQYTCGAFGDDKEYPVGKSFWVEPENLSMRNECFTCPLFDLCNGCAKTINDHKRHDMTGTHCFEMKQMESQLMELRDDLCV